ncbi:hypothetical protein LIN78_00245 [Leeia sp. TBRC 13508]|uniref:DUF7931 domain-containing protein n=1 Tax=Leeia speluncae TaxID=2884804 RepID=A0ABS8D1C6_9NEIS|nr:hypothetical protein [Leeia speluncae]MCB6181984.1 hypothetical protein [Leeia speluncae]
MTNDAASGGMATRVLTTSYGELDDAMLSILTHARQHIKILSMAWDYPLLERKSFADALENYLRASRLHLCQIVLMDATSAERNAERLKRLVRLFSDQLQVHTPGRQLANIQDNFILVDGAHLVRQLHYAQPRTVAIGNDKKAVKPYELAFETLWESSHVAIHATVLGL